MLSVIFPNSNCHIFSKWTCNITTSVILHTHFKIFLQCELGILWSDINSQGYNLVDVANAIKEVAAIYNIAVLDLLEEGNFESIMYDSDCDGIHPNQKFVLEVMAPQIAQFIKNNYN